MTGRPRVPGLNADWADQQLDLLAELRAAMDAVEAAPVQPDPPVCRNCTHVADVPGGPVFACQSARGCLLDRLGPEMTRDRGHCASDGGPYAACHWTCQGKCTPGADR